MSKQPNKSTKSIHSYYTPPPVLGNICTSLILQKQLSLNQHVHLYVSFLTNNHGQSHQTITWPDGIHQMFMITENTKCFPISASLANKNKREKRPMWVKEIPVSGSISTKKIGIPLGESGRDSWCWCNHRCFIKEMGWSCKVPCLDTVA